MKASGIIPDGAQRANDPAHSEPVARAPIDYPSEIVIGIIPRGDATYEGTAAQLIEEGIAPAGFEWRKARGEGLRWNDARFEYWAHSYRPEGTSFKDWKESDQDYGAIRQRDLTLGRDGYAAANVYQKKADLANAIWRSSPAGARQFNLYYKAHVDSAFQTFLLRAGAKKAPKPRKPRIAQ